MGGIPAELVRGEPRSSPPLTKLSGVVAQAWCGSPPYPTSKGREWRKPIASPLFNQKVLLYKPLNSRFWVFSCYPLHSPNP